MKMHPVMRRVMAIRPHKYGTRHLTAGEEYEAPPRHAFALVAARKARFVAEKPVPAQEPEAAVPAERVEAPSMNLEILRHQATQLGIDVDGRWGIARLQHEIDQARGR